MRITKNHSLSQCLGHAYTKLCPLYCILVNVTNDPMTVSRGVRRGGGVCTCIPVCHTGRDIGGAKLKIKIMKLNNLYKNRNANLIVCPSAQNILAVLLTVSEEDVVA